MIASLPETHDPFALLPDPHRYVPRPATERALEALGEALESGTPALLHGPPGLGKSLLLRVLVERLPKDYTHVCLSWVPANCEDLCAAVLDELAGEDAPDPEAALLIRATLLERRGRPLLLLLDGADSLDAEQAARLAGVLRAARGAMRVVLAAADGPAVDRLEEAFGPGIRAVALREPMDLAETRAYLVARCERDDIETPLRDEILAHSETLHERCSGNPRELHAAVSELQLQAWKRGPGADLLPHPRSEPLPLIDLEAELAAAAWPVAESNADPVERVPAPEPPHAAEPEADAIEAAAPESSQAIAAAAPTTPELAPAPVLVPPPARRGARRTAALWGFALGVLAGSGLTAAVFALVLSRPADPSADLAALSTPEPLAPAHTLTAKAVPPPEGIAVVDEPSLPGEPPHAPQMEPPPSPTAELASAATAAAQPEPTQSAAAPPEPAIAAAPEPNAGDPSEATSADAPAPDLHPEPPAPPPEPAPVAAAPVAAAPVDPPAPLHVNVNVNARPWATISIDGVEVGETPLGDLPVERGTHLFRARMPDGTVHERQVRVTHDGTRVLFP